MHLIYWRLIADQAAFLPTIQIKLHYSVTEIHGFLKTFCFPKIFQLIFETRFRNCVKIVIFKKVLLYTL